MGLQERIYSVLLVSSSDSFIAATAEMLPPSRYKPVFRACSVSQAKRVLAERAFDFVIINSPITDDSGTGFAIDICNSRSTVPLLLVPTDIYAEVYEDVVEHGVFTLPKPTSRTMIQQALCWMSSARERLRQIEQRTSSLDDRMKEIRIVNMAKLLVITKLQKTESEAHHYIEKFAMDNCITKKAAAEIIIKQNS